MRVLISSKALAAIRAHAAAEPDQEVCGLLFGDTGHVAEARPATNVSPEPTRRFEIDPTALFAANREERAGGSALIGYYHSHPFGSPEPSATDRAEAAVDGKLWLIVAGAQVRGWRSTGEGFRPVDLQSVDQCTAPVDG